MTLSHDAPNSKALRDAIFTRIGRSHVVIIPTGTKEIDGALGYDKPILAVHPWGQQRSSDVVVSNADRAVGWNKGPLIRAIWALYRS